MTLGILARATLSRRARLMRGAARATALVAALAAGPVSAETIGGALVKAYINNPDINQQRAATRASDENIPQANAGFLPTVSATANASVQQTNARDPITTGATSGKTLLDQTSYPRGANITVTQNVFNGNRTINGVREAESGVLGQREQLRNTEQNVLQDAVTAYMDVLKNTAVLSLNRNNVDVLKEQLRQTQDRFTVGEVTRTDVAQAQASLAGAQATAIQSEATLQNSIANYHQTIGEDPKSLSPVKPLDKVLPRGLAEAIAISQVEHPAIVASLHGVDVAELKVKIAEGALYPSVNLQGQVGQNYDVSGGLSPNHAFTASVIGQISVPIYDGGLTYASTRQAKEQLGQQELATDLQRNKVRAAVVSAWGNLQSATAAIKSYVAQVKAAEVALEGIREEAKVGQRTTFDVLTAQQTLLNSRVQLVTAQHDQVVASYEVMSAVGRLSTRTLGLKVAEYDPKVHFNQVKDKWFGLRTPDGR